MFTSDIITKAELSRYPLVSNIIKYTYNYLQHILNVDQNSLLYKAFLHNVVMDRNGRDTYYTRIRNLLLVLQIEKISETCKINNESIKIEKKYNVL